MIKLKTEVVKKHLIEQLKLEAELIYKNSWQPKLQERAFIDGAEALFKLLRLGDVVGQSEQLLAFAQWIQKNGNHMTPEKQVKYYETDSQ